MKTCDQHFSPEIMKRIQQAMEDESDNFEESYHGKSAFCEWLDWRALNGKLQELIYRKGFNKLAAKGYITLPEVTHDYAYIHAKKALAVHRGQERCSRYRFCENL